MAFVRNPVVYVPDLTNGRPIVDGKVYLLTAGTVPPAQDSAINPSTLLTVTYINEAGNTVEQPQPLYTSKGGCLYGSFPEEARQYMITPQEYVFAAYDKIGRLQYSAETFADDYVESAALAAVDSTVLIGGVEAVDVVSAALSSQEKVDALISPPYVSRLYDIHPANSGSVNHAAIQLLLDNMAVSGGGYINLHEKGVYQVSENIELRDNTGIRGFNVYRDYAINKWAINLANGKSIVVTGNHAGLENLTLATSASSEAALLRFIGSPNKQGLFRNLGFNGGAIQQLDTTNSIASVFEDIILVNGLKGRAGFTNYVGAMIAGGTDNFFNRIEANATSGFTGIVNGFAAAIQLNGTNNWLTDCIGELSDVGLAMTGGAKNRISNFRSDLNWGHGVVMTGGEVTINGLDCINNAKSGVADTYSGIVATTGNISGSVSDFRVLNAESARMLYAADLSLAGNSNTDFSVGITKMSNVLNAANTNDFYPYRVTLPSKVTRLTLSGSETSINVNGVTTLIFSSPSPVSISNLTGGFYGQEVDLISADPDITLVHGGAGSDNMYMFNAANVALGSYEKSVRFKRVPRGGSGARWVQI